MTRLPAADTVSYFTPHKSLTVCKHKHFRELWITDIAQMSLYINLKPRFVIFANDIRLNPLHCCSHSALPSHCAPRCDGRAKSVGGGAVAHIFIVSFSKWSITFNVSYQQMVKAAFMCHAMCGCLAGLNAGNWDAGFSPGFLPTSASTSWKKKCHMQLCVCVLQIT